MPSPNHLSEQTSPYLLQHLYNPVDWYPWGDEAISKAKRENKPILISIGYSTCHWCHVMERESFENTEVAELMNRNFVCIKVDREERPDIDHIYMSAVQLLGMQGGWPLNCFALPDGRPFWGSTYFPVEQWKSILTQIIELYKNKTDILIEQAENLSKGIASSGFVKSGETKSAFKIADTEIVFRNIMKYMDFKKGGTLNAPKFPLPVYLGFLLYYYYLSTEKSSIDQLKLSLDSMAMGGIYDQAGGGFFRYSTDEDWKVPHFEKMLYDNGQLISLYSNAWKLLKKDLYKNVVYQSIEFIDREMTSPEGLFYSALDADSEGEEGKFYLWKEDEINKILGKDANLIKEYYQIGKKALWENRNNILLRDESDESFSSRKNMSLHNLQKTIKNAGKNLLLAREKRIRPGLDNKILTSWNALMIKGLSDAYAAFGKKSFLKKAMRAADILIRSGMTKDFKLYRNTFAGGSVVEGFLEDYALFIQALIRLYEVSMKSDYLTIARSLAIYVINNFSGSGTNLFSFSSVHAKTFETPVYISYDGVMSSSNSVMAMNLFFLASYFENKQFEERSSQMLSDMLDTLKGQSIGYANWGSLLLMHTYPFYTLVVCGTDAEKALNKLSIKYLPNVLIAATSSPDTLIPVLKDRFRPGQNWYYVCSMGYCKEPVTELNAALKQI